jgi:hypothetical protein
MHTSRLWSCSWSDAQPETSCINCGRQKFSSFIAALVHMRCLSNRPRSRRKSFRRLKEGSAVATAPVCHRFSLFW